MSPNELLILGLIFAIVGHAVITLFKSPKTINDELAKSLVEVKEDHEALARRFERHDEVVKNLIQALDRLTMRIDRLEPYLMKPTGRRGG
jgi:hypothetical protein